MFRHVVGGAALALALLLETASAGAGTINMDGPAPPDAPSIGSRLAGTWGACGSWWTETATETTSGSVCGVDGLVEENGVATQLAEPLVAVSRYVCVKRRRGENCTSDEFQGTVRRSDLTVDPLLRRATIRGVLGGCSLDIEFAGVGPARPGGNVSQWHGLNGGPQVGVSGGESFTSDAQWWGGVCGRTVIVGGTPAQASMFRGVEAAVSGFANQRGCECDE